MAKHPIWGQNSSIAKSITALTDSSGGTASNTIPEQTGSYVEADVANAIASLAAKVNAILAALEKHGLTDSTGQ